MNTTKTAQELIAEQTAKLERMKSRAAIDGLKDHPALLDVMSRFEEATAAEITHGKGFSTSKQSFANRRMSHSLWLDEIDAAERHAALALDLAKAQKEYVQGELAHLASLDVEITEVDANRILANLPCSLDSCAAYSEFTTAQDARKDFNTIKAQPKRVRVAVAEILEQPNHADS